MITGSWSTYAKKIQPDYVQFSEKLNKRFLVSNRSNTQKLLKIGKKNLFFDKKSFCKPNSSQSMTSTSFLFSPL